MKPAHGAAILLLAAYAVFMLPCAQETAPTASNLRLETSNKPPLSSETTTVKSHKQDKQGVDWRTILFHDRKSGRVDESLKESKICTTEANKRWHLPPEYKRNDPPVYDGNTAKGHCRHVWQSNVYNRAAALAGKSNWLVDCGCGGGLKAVELYKRGYKLVLIERPGPNLEHAKKHIMRTSRYQNNNEREKGVYFVELSFVDYNDVSVLLEKVPREVFQGAVINSADVIEHVATPERLLLLVKDLFSLGANTFVSSTPERVAHRGSKNMGPDPTRSNAQLWSISEYVDFLHCSPIPGQLHYTWTQNYEGSSEWVTILTVVTTRQDLPWPLDNSPALPNIVHHGC